ncbi:hypothetical protein N9E76_00565 [bacterium]|nr:hypothetical protein [bacterium]
MQVEAAAVLYVPGEQSLQLVEELAPVIAKNLPVGQYVHVGAPNTSEYLPLGQLVQVEEATLLYEPAGQGMHPLPSEENFPEAQSGHVEVVPNENLPAGHSVHMSET